VIPTKGAIIPAAVGVDIGCGMMAVRTSLTASDLPDDLKHLRSTIERVGAARPHRTTAARVTAARGRTCRAHRRERVEEAARRLPSNRRTSIPKIDRGATAEHLGTLGTGNHFIELCPRRGAARVVMLHSGSRGVGNRIGTYFIELAKKDMRQHLSNLPDRTSPTSPKGRALRRLRVRGRLGAALRAHEPRPHDAVDPRRARAVRELPKFDAWRGRGELPPQLRAAGGALRRHGVRDAQGRGARRVGELGIIPGSMGAGRTSCAARATRRASTRAATARAAHVARRGEAALHARGPCEATAGVECRKDADVIDETPGAYKDIDAVMAAQQDLVEVVHTLKQVVCVKG
jgi:tRNA-splicing ligase RtcB